MTKYAFSIDEIIDAQKLAHDLKLDNWEKFCSKTPASLQKICNGIGADWMPEWSRKLLDKRYCVLKVPCMIHDMDYQDGTGTHDDFRAANERLKQNGYKVTKSQFSWYSPARYAVMNDARRLGAVCNVFGWKAYVEAIKARNVSETQSVIAIP